MKVGDLVKWARHTNWQYHGLGFIAETKQLDESVGWKYRIMWHVDIHDIPDYQGLWYYSEDFKSGAIVKV